MAMAKSVRHEGSPQLVRFEARGRISGAVAATPTVARLFAAWLALQHRWRVSVMPLPMGTAIAMGEGDLAMGEVLGLAFEQWSRSARGHG
jgi:hypothetical protein